MSELSLPAAPSVTTAARLPLLPVFAWRNLWRNRKRSWLTIGGVAFAIVLISGMRGFQVGTYDAMEQIGTGMLAGHAQVETPAHTEDGRLADVVDNATELANRLRTGAGIQAVLPRVEAFALLSVGERSFGGLVWGIDVEQEQRWLSYLSNPSSGRLPSAADEAVIGIALARNLRTKVGDELVALGSTPQGSVAALVFRITGLIETPSPELNRSLLVTSQQTIQDGFELQDQVHRFVVIGRNPSQARSLAQVLNAQLTALASAKPERERPRARPWQEVIPELSQSIQLDAAGGLVIYFTIIIMILFSVANSFLITTFERTQEFGMLRALGMRAGQIVGLLQWECFFAAVIGCLLGAAICIALVYWLRIDGISMTAVENASQYYLPSVIRPRLSPETLAIPCAIMLLGSMLAALIPSLRVFRLQPVEALRDE